MKINLTVFNMAEFLDTVASCSGPVYLRNGNSGKTAINSHSNDHNNLIRQYGNSKKLPRLPLLITDYRDYLKIINFSIFDI